MKPSILLLCLICIANGRASAQEEARLPVAAAVDSNPRSNPPPLTVKKPDAKELGALDRGAQKADDQGITSKDKVLTSPELVVRAFIYGTLVGDREILQRRCLEHPDLDLLYSMPLADGFKRLAKASSQIPLHSIEVGESLAMPNGDIVTISEAMVNQNRKIFAASLAPALYTVVRIDGQWRIDASEFIEIARSQAEE